MPTGNTHTQKNQVEKVNCIFIFMTHNNMKLKYLTLTKISAPTILHKIS